SITTTACAWTGSDESTYGTPTSDELTRRRRSLVSRLRNSLCIEGGEAPDWQGAKSEHIGNMGAMSNAARRDASPAECQRISETRHYSVPWAVPASKGD